MKMKITDNDKKKYSEFISGLNLKKIFLVSANVNFNDSVFSDTVGQLTVHVEQNAIYEKMEKKNYRISQDWEIVVGDEKEDVNLIDLKFRFVILINSERNITKRIFKIYEENNLILNVWPFTRELVNNMTARMGIPPLTLPFFKSFPKA
jgi:preprotein translocase subunit SecB